MRSKLWYTSLLVMGFVWGLTVAVGPFVWGEKAGAEEPAAHAAEPYLSVESPEYPDGRYPELILSVKERELKVTGAAAPGAVVRVNGVLAQVDGGEGHFTASVALHEGYNAVVVVAQWPNGSVIRILRPVLFDPVPPHLSVEPVASPEVAWGSTGQRWFTKADRVRLQGQVEPSATVTAWMEESAEEPPLDDEGLWGFWDEEPADGNGNEAGDGGDGGDGSGGNDRSPVRVAQDGTFFWEGSLHDGTNHIRVRATDVAGNVTEISVVVVRSLSPPDLWVDEPLKDTQTREPKVMVRGRTDPDSRVEVNGLVAAVDPEGNFQAQLQLTSKTNRIRIRAVDPVGNAAEVERVVKWDTDPPVVRSVQPIAAQHLSAGESLYVQANGESGATAWFNIGQRRLNIPMAEVQTGAYRGVYRIQPQDDFDEETITVVMRDKAGNEGKATGTTVTTLDPAVPTVVEVGAADATLRAGPDASYDRLAQGIQGVRFEVVAKSGEWAKVRLSPTQTAWTHMENVRELPIGTPPPNAVVGNVSATRVGSGVRITLRLSEPTAYILLPDVRTASLRVQLFNASFGLYHMSYGPNTELIGLMSLSQPAAGVSELLINLTSKHVAGYRARLEGGNLVIDISDPLTRSLKDRTITLDPGHGGGESGAIGPTGLREADVNLQIALLLKDRLEQAGAHVVMTRTGDTFVSPNGGGAADLYARVTVAEQSGSDLFISIHNNAVGAANALNAQGSEMYYYTPYSAALARSVQERMTAKLGTAYRFAAYRSFAVIRQWTMPAILVEGDFISHPDVEQRMRGDEFAEKAAEGIFDGIVAFLEQVGEAGQEEEEAPR